MGLGDAIAAALMTVGISKERVSRWLGRECHCKERQEKLNSLGRWASRILSGKGRGEAEKHLKEIMDE